MGFNSAFKGLKDVYYDADDDDADDDDDDADAAAAADDDDDAWPLRSGVIGLLVLGG